MQTNLGVHFIDHQVAAIKSPRWLSSSTQARVQRTHNCPAEGKAPVLGANVQHVRPRLRAGTTFTWETQHPCMSGRPSSGLPHKQPANKAVRGLEVAYPVSVHLGQEFSLCHFGFQDDRFASAWRQKPRTEFSWPPMQPKGHPARRGQAARHINGFHNI